MQKKHTIANKPSEIEIEKPELGKSESGLNQSYETSNAKEAKAPSDHKRILITGINSLVGHGLFEQMRNDHELIGSNKKADKFMGTLIQKDEKAVPVPSSSV